MTLETLIRKGGLTELAAGVPKPETLPSVATVASVAVANPPNSPDQDAFAERAAIIQANGVPRAWAEGIARLDTMPRPKGYTQTRWAQVVNDGGVFLDAWGRQAAALGWKAEDVFGVCPTAPETAWADMGLVPLLAGRRVLAITGTTARIACGNGITQTYTRTPTTGAVALWQLEHRP